MWGTHGRGLRGRVPARFIPTHVGNTLLTLPRFWLCSVHPHACGEHPISLTMETSYSGSSPRMWGTLSRRDDLCHGSRFIPTHVGNTLVRANRRQNPAVHPHACGEHRENTRHIRPGYGSSPRMWGTPHILGNGHSQHRFIPTHVGNTPVAMMMSRSTAVHPHACGEHANDLTRSWSIDGSSPRMWGTLAL